MIVAFDLRDAIDRAIRHQPDVLAMETHSSNVQGFHFVRSLRGVIEHDTIVIGIAMDPDKLSEASRHAGFDECCPTTVESDAFEHAVERSRSAQ